MVMMIIRVGSMKKGLIIWKAFLYTYEADENSSDEDMFSFKLFDFTRTGQFLSIPFTCRYVLLELLKQETKTYSNVQIVQNVRRENIVPGVSQIVHFRSWFILPEVFNEK